MDYTDVKTFFQGLATEHGWGFAHNTEQLQDEIDSNKEWAEKYILTMDEPRGAYRYIPDRFHDQPSYGFFLHRPVAKGDWAKEDEYYQAAKTYFETLILTDIQEQMENEDGIWQFFEGSMDYRKSGPLGKERLFGIYVSLGTQGVV